MSKPHKWAKEIKAWADGAEIEWRTNNGSMHTEWREAGEVPNWHVAIAEFRIKSQPKEPQYLYVMLEEGSAFIYSKQEFEDIQDCIEEHGTYIGKIKLENKDETV